MKKKKNMCTMLARMAPSFPGLLDDGESDDKVMTAQYYCVKTANAVGPDNNVVNPQECGAGRACFRPD